jgi:hypothetical protein
MRGKTIITYLPDGNPKGIKICEMPTSIVKGILIPRNKLNEVSKHIDLSKVGIYFLLSEKEDLDVPYVYIGEGEDLIKRIKQHDIQSQEYWNFAIAFISDKENINKAHVKFLENHCYHEAKNYGRCLLKNSVIPTKSSLTDQERDFVLDFFDELRILLGNLGHPLFEAHPEMEETELFYCTGKDAKGVGTLTEEGFIVYNASTANLLESPSAGSWLINMREKLVREGFLEEKDDKLIFSKSVEFNSPSAAAGVVLARRANGWTEWKTKEGKTLDELKRQENKEK